MRWNSRALHLVRRLRWFAAAMACSMLVTSALAAGGVRVTPISSIATSPSTTLTHFEVSSVSLDDVIRQTEYRSRSAPLSSKTVGSLARKGLRGGVYGIALSLAIDGIIDGAGWAIGELQDQVMDGPVREPEMAPPGVEMACNPAYTICVPVASASSLCPYIQSLSKDYTVCSLKMRDGNFLIFQVTPGGGSYAAVVRRFEEYKPIFGTGYQPSPVSDEQLGDAIKQHPEIVNDLLTDPRTGYPIVTPELQKQIDDIKKEVEQREGLPSSDPSPTPNLDDDTATDTDTKWPTFCGWATKVCEFIDWFKKPSDKEVELPEQEVDIDTKGWSSGIGGGSCPGPSEFSVTVVGHNGTAAYEWQPVCDFATKMRPFLIFVCSLVSVLIIAGLRGGSKA